MGFIFPSIGVGHQDSPQNFVQSKHCRASALLILKGGVPGAGHTKAWGACSLPSPSVVCQSVVDLEQRFLTFLESGTPQKKPLAKYMSEMLQQFQEFSDLPETQPRAWDQECPPAAHYTHTTYSRSCLGSVWATCYQCLVTLVNKGESTLLGPFAATNSWGTACSLSICWPIGSRSPKRVREQIPVQSREEVGGGIMQHITSTLPENDAYRMVLGQMWVARDDGFLVGKVQIYPEMVFIVKET